MAANKAIFIDRIEGSRAVALLEGSDDPFEVPTDLLPDGVAEGQWYTLGWTRDTDREAAVGDALRARRARLSKDDDGGDFSL